MRETRNFCVNLGEDGFHSHLSRLSYCFRFAQLTGSIPLTISHSIRLSDRLIEVSFLENRKCRFLLSLIGDKAFAVEFILNAS